MKQLGAQGQSKEVYIFQGINCKIFKKGPKVVVIFIRVNTKKGKLLTKDYT